MPAAKKWIAAVPLTDPKTDKRIEPGTVLKFKPSKLWIDRGTVKPAETKGK